MPLVPSSPALTRLYPLQTDAQRLLRKLLALNVLAEDTFRQDNAYQTMSSAIRVGMGYGHRWQEGTRGVEGPGLVIKLIVLWFDSCKDAPRT